MESSKRAMESYWRSRMVDGSTTDDDKITPVYKIDEICDLLRSSNVGIVREVSELVLKRLEHRSPFVKQKALRLIKYAVSKSGPEFRREMQARVAAIRPLINYKGQLDPVKGDAVNKTVRDTAQETISAIFSQPENKPIASADLNRRIQGFGNTSYEAPSDDKKSFLSEVVGIGSTSIKQGLSSFARGQLFIRSKSGSHLRSSLTSEDADMGKYEAVEERTQAMRSSGASNNEPSESWNPEVGKGMGYREWDTGVSASSNIESKSREELLLETIVNSGGVRLQPTRDAIQAFLLEAAKVEPMALCRALENKLQSSQWQVRTRAVCILDAIVRRKADDPFSVVASYFRESCSAIICCSESPQATLREKASKVLSLLGGCCSGSLAGESVKLGKHETITGSQMLNPVDTKHSNEIKGMRIPSGEVVDAKSGSLPNQKATSIEDLLECDISLDDKVINKRGYNGPFADVSFHTGQIQEPTDSLLGGTSLQKEYHVNSPATLMAGLSVNENAPVNTSATGDNHKAPFSEALFTDSKSVPNYHVSKDALNNPPGLNCHIGGVASKLNAPAGGYPYVIPPGIILNSAFASQPIEYAAIENFLVQQQYLAAFSNFHFQGSLNNQNLGGSIANGGYYSSSFPGIFPPQAPDLVGNGLKNEETKAFDFISDHLAATAHESKRVA